VRADGPLFYANAVNVEERLLDLVRASEPRPDAVVLELAESSDLDVETLDALDELARALADAGVELRLRGGSYAGARAAAPQRSRGKGAHRAHRRRRCQRG
jgi:MFS superfamily sulfate permease-like transporter